MRTDDILKYSKSIESQLIAWRRDFHAHPEMGFEEYRTADVIANILQKMGIKEVETSVGRTGVVGRLGKGKPVVAIRADMDAVPVQEENDFEYCSKNPGVMHGCGHDAHVAMLLGAARVLLQLDNRPEGEIRLLFQPSEEQKDSEGKSGATRMVEDGALEGVDAVIALHVESMLPAGIMHVDQAAYVSGSNDLFEGKIIGRGGHGAVPNEAIDSVFLLAQVINAIYGIISRRIDPTKPATISIGYVNGGINVGSIPECIEIKGVTRSYEPEVRKQLLVELEKAFSLTRTFGGDYELNIVGGYPSIYNDPVVAQEITIAIRQLWGDKALIDPVLNMGGEDFSEMTQVAPGAMFILGAQIDGEKRAHHGSIFDIDESVMKIGTSVLVESACRLLERYQG